MATIQVEQTPRSVNVDQRVNDDLVREVETKFANALLGKSEVPLEYPMSYYTAPLVVAYRQAHAMNLPENLILKHCCTVLIKIINDNQTEKIRQALNPR